MRNSMARELRPRPNQRRVSKYSMAPSLKTALPPRRLDRIVIEKRGFRAQSRVGVFFFGAGTGASAGASGAAAGASATSGSGSVSASPPPDDVVGDLDDLGLHKAPPARGSAHCVWPVASFSKYG